MVSFEKNRSDSPPTAIGAYSGRANCRFFFLANVEDAAAVLLFSGVGIDYIHKLHD